MPDQLTFEWMEPPEPPQPEKETAKAQKAEKPAPVPRRSTETAPKPKPADPARDEMLEKARSLRTTLVQRTKHDLRIVVNDNSSTMLTMRMDRFTGVVEVRLHHMFLDAPEPVLDALAHWIKHPRSAGAGAAINAFIRSQNHKVRPKPRRAICIRTRGHCYDLQALYQEVNAAHFENRVNAHITWGNTPPRGNRRSIRFGSYMERDNVIRIHPLLDQPLVPDFFIRFIVFHEMLHADLGTRVTPSGRRSMHSPEFRARERAYPDYARATEWESQHKNLDALLRRKRK